MISKHTLSIYNTLLLALTYEEISVRIIKSFSGHFSVKSVNKNIQAVPHCGRPGTRNQNHPINEIAFRRFRGQVERVPA